MRVSLYLPYHLAMDKSKLVNTTQSSSIYAFETLQKPLVRPSTAAGLLTNALRGRSVAFT